MRVGPICNFSLLQVISNAKEITYEELRRKYLPPQKPGIVQGVEVMFDSDLETLITAGYVSREGDIIRFIGR